MNPTEIINDLSALMGLRLQETPSIEIDSKSAPRRLIGQLVRQKYIPSYQTAPDDLKWLVEGEGDCQPDTTIHVIDLLGVYDSRKNKIIIIYDLLIKLCSFQLNIDYEALKAIVMMHELSHAITHRGIDSDNIFWDYFDIATPDIKEYFAQIYPYKKMKRDGEILLMSIMDKLTDTQSAIYQTYRNSIEFPIEKINNELAEARRTVPNGFEVYPSAVSEQWEITFNNLQKYREPFYGYWDPPTAPPPPGKLVTSGTELRISANTIKIRSYDYSPSSDVLPKESTCVLYKILSEKEIDIKEKASSKQSDIPFFSISFHGAKHHLNLKDPFVVALYNQVVDVISSTYPTLGKVMRGYEKDF